MEEKIPKLNYIQRKDKTYVIWPYLVGKGFLFDQKIYGDKELKEIHWTGHEHMMFFCESKNDEIKNMTTNLSEYIFQNPKHAIDVKKQFLKYAGKMIRFTNKLKKVDLSKIHSSDLIQMFKEFEELYITCYNYGEPLPFLSKDLPDKVKEVFINNYQGNSEDFEKLITDPELNFIQQEMLDMLKLKEEKADIMLIRQKIEKHKNKWEWIPFDYGAYTYDFKHFENEYSEFDIKKHQYLKTYTEDTKKEIIQLEDIYNLNKHMKTLFESIRISSFLMNHKKELFTKLHFYFDPFFKEIAKRCNLELPIVKSIYPFELESVLKNDREQIEKIKQRFEYVYLITKKDGIEEKIGQEAKSIFEKFYSERNPDTDTNEIIGKTGYTGNTTGFARVIHDSNECVNLKEGEILVTPMTSPDFMIAVKKASAIITDEGGITCHAAIISRELKIPCIIGTKNATHTFKTGDLLEVNADEGIVRKISD